MRRTNKLSLIPNSITESRGVSLFSSKVSNCKTRLDGLLWRGVCGGTHFLGLDHGAWETVQEETVAALGFRQVGVDEVHHQFVAHQQTYENMVDVFREQNMISVREMRPTLVHGLLQRAAQFRTRGHFGSEHVSSGQMADTVLLLQIRSLRRAISYEEMTTAKQISKYFQIDLPVCLCRSRADPAGRR